MSTDLRRSVKAHLALRGITQSAIARRLKVTPQMVSHVIAGRRASRRVRKAIATAIGRDPWQTQTRRKAS